MPASPVLTPTEILTVVRHWSVEERLTLLQAILQTLQGDLPGNTRPPTLERALGLAATDQPPPDDATVEQWRDERRQARYG